MTETAGSLVKVTYYVEVLSSWCNLAEPAWDEAKSQFPDEVSFDWAIALMNPDGVPVSRDQADWFLPTQCTHLTGWLCHELGVV